MGVDKIFEPFGSIKKIKENKRIHEVLTIPAIFLIWSQKYNTTVLKTLHSYVG